MTILLQDALERLAAIEVEALAGLTPPIDADAKPFSIWSQEAFPYFTHRTGGITVEPDSQDIDLYEVEVVARLVIGHVTEGYRGQSDERLNTWIPVIMNAINARELLQSAAYPVALVGLIGARCTFCTGQRVIETAGVQARQVGTEFTIVLQFADGLTQEYL